MFIEILIFLIFLLCLDKYVSKYSRFGKYMRDIPGPTAWPIVGSLPYVIFPKYPTQERIWKIGRDLDTKYYPIWKFWTFLHVFVIILHPDDLEKLLTSTKHTEKSILYNCFHGWLGTGLLTSKGAKWQKRRKMLTPAFHFTVLKQYFKSIVEHSKETMEMLMSNGESTYDVSELITDYTLKVICDTAMGCKFTDRDFLKKYREAVHYLGGCVIYRSLHPWCISEFIFGLTEKGRKYKKALRIVHSFTKKIIKERKEFHERTDEHFLNEFLHSKDSNEIEHHGYDKKRLAMLDLLIAQQRNGGQIDDAGIQEEVDTFTFGGHDTLASALLFAILLFAEHKDVQERARIEVSNILNQNNGKLGIAGIQQFNYLEMCLKECLRLYPSAQYTSRVIPEDLQLSNHLLPKGTMTQIHVYSVHRDPEFWPEPDKFDPERFSAENASKRHPFAYIPFSAGSRNCIGQKFAMMELKAFMTLLIYHFYLEPMDFLKDVELVADIIIRPSRSVRAKLVPIKK